MAKRDAEPEPIDEQPVDDVPPPVGERLRAAREERGLSLEDVAAQTRIPQRHLERIETGDWENLPAATYTIGFAKNYAGVVGLDRMDVGNQLREEMGGQRFASTSADVFEPADPARTMPKSLVLGAIVAVIVLVALMSWLNGRSLDQGDDSAANVAATSPIAAPTQQPAATPAAVPANAQGPVVLSATAPAWIQVTDQGKSLFQGLLQPGQNFTVPQTAGAPMLKAGKPEALRVTVGAATAPPVGPPGKVTTVSLLPADLMKGPAAQAAPPPPIAAPRPRPRAAALTPAAPPPAPAPVEPAPTTNTGE